MSVQSRQVAVVTGASGGIGLELARLLARDGHDLVIVAQHPDRLAHAGRELAASGARVVEVAADLSDPATPPRIQEAMRQLGPAARVLVNNAGFGLWGAFAEIDIDEQLRLIDVNVRALTHLTALMLPGMLERRMGWVLNVASTAAFQPGPRMAVYYASKAYVLSFSEALAYETRNAGVTVTALCPGPTATAFEARARLEGARLFRRHVMDPAVVARAGYEGLKRGARVVVPGWRNVLGTWIVRLAPRRMVLEAVRQLHESA